MARKGQVYTPTSLARRLILHNLLGSETCFLQTLHIACVWEEAESFVLELLAQLNQNIKLLPAEVERLQLTNNHLDIVRQVLYLDHLEYTFLRFIRLLLLLGLLLRLLLRLILDRCGFLLEGASCLAHDCLFALHPQLLHLCLLGFPLQILLSGSMEVETFLDYAQIDHLYVLLFFFIHELGLQRGGLIIKGGLLRLDEVTNVARLSLDRRN